MIELSVMAAIGIASAVAGAGGSMAVTKYKTSELERDIVAIKLRQDKHSADDDQIHREILRALGRIEGTLQELKRNNS